MLDPRHALIAAALLFGAPAFAQDENDLDDLEDDIDFDPAPRPAAPTDPQPPAPEPDDGDEQDGGLEDFRDDGEEIDLLGEEPTNPQGADSETVYRATAARLGKLEPDEELAGWEAYLAQYPNSAFRKRIESRMDELTDLIYSGGPQQTGPVDAMRQELDFAQAMQLENINPRDRLQIGFEWGLPDFLNLSADYEKALARQVSFHAGLRRRYLGYNIEAGMRFALVKSIRTGTLVTVIADARLNTIPAYPGFRPQLAIGKRFGKVDAQIQGGADFTLQPVVGFQPAATGGASLYYAASDRVGVFAETALYMKPVAEDGAFPGGTFRFNVVDFGMKFFPGSGDKRDMEINFGATVPYMQQWWQFHYGSVMGQFNYYL
ncbi:MAG: hypothetical protein R3F59_35730 [Myxococcota bacterium]